MTESMPSDRENSNSRHLLDFTVSLILIEEEEEEEEIQRQRLHLTRPYLCMKTRQMLQISKRSNSNP